MLHNVKTITVQCPQCKKSSSFDETNIYRPFCSDRCKLIDLGGWANEEYTIPIQNEIPSADLSMHEQVDP